MYRREDNTKMYLRKIGQEGVIWIKLVRDMVEQLDLVNPVTYLGA
jgi:hypothetical protein